MLRLITERTLELVRTKKILFGVDSLQGGKNLFIGGDVGHVMTVVNEADFALFIHNDLTWHATKLEKVDLLPEEFEDLMAGIR